VQQTTAPPLSGQRATTPSVNSQLVNQTIKMDLIVGSDSSWVQVWVDGKTVAVLNELVSNKTVHFEGTQKIEIALGKPAAVKIMVNGQEKQYAPPNSGTVIKVFRADGSEAVIPQ